MKLDRLCVHIEALPGKSFELAEDQQFALIQVLVQFASTLPDSPRVVFQTFTTAIKGGAS